MSNELEWRAALEVMLADPRGAVLTAYSTADEGTELIARGALARDVRYEDGENGIIVWLRPLMDPEAVQGYVETFDLDSYRPRGHAAAQAFLADDGAVTFVNPDRHEVVEIRLNGEAGSALIDDWDEWLARQPEDYRDFVGSLNP